MSHTRDRDTFSLGTTYERTALAFSKMGAFTNYVFGLFLITLSGPVLSQRPPFLRRVPFRFGGPAPLRSPFGFGRVPFVTGGAFRPLAPGLTIPLAGGLPRLTGFDALTTSGLTLGTGLSPFSTTLGDLSAGGGLGLAFRRGGQLTGNALAGPGQVAFARRQQQQILSRRRTRRGRTRRPTIPRRRAFQTIPQIPQIPFNGQARQVLPPGNTIAQLGRPRNDQTFRPGTQANLPTSNTAQANGGNLQTGQAPQPGSNVIFPSQAAESPTFVSQRIPTPTGGFNPMTQQGAGLNGQQLPQIPQIPNGPALSGFQPLPPVGQSGGSLAQSAQMMFNPEAFRSRFVNRPSPQPMGRLNVQQFQTGAVGVPPQFMAGPQNQMFPQSGQQTFQPGGQQNIQPGGQQSPVGAPTTRVVTVPQMPGFDGEAASTGIPTAAQIDQFNQAGEMTTGPQGGPAFDTATGGTQSGQEFNIQFQPLPDQNNQGQNLQGFNVQNDPSIQDQNSAAMGFNPNNQAENTMSGFTVENNQGQGQNSMSAFNINSQGQGSMSSFMLPTNAGSMDMPGGSGGSSEQAQPAGAGGAQFELVQVGNVMDSQGFGLDQGARTADMTVSSQLDMAGASQLDTTGASQFATVATESQGPPQTVDFNTGSQSFQSGQGQMDPIEMGQGQGQGFQPAGNINTAFQEFPGDLGLGAETAGQGQPQDSQPSKAMVPSGNEILAPAAQQDFSFFVSSDQKGQPQSNTLDQQPPANDLGFGQQPPANNQGFDLQPPANNQGFDLQPPANNPGFDLQPSANNQGFDLQPSANNQGFDLQPPANDQGFSFSKATNTGSEHGGSLIEVFPSAESFQQVLDLTAASNTTADSLLDVGINMISDSKSGNLPADSPTTFDFPVRGSSASGQPPEGFSFVQPNSEATAATDILSQPPSDQGSTSASGFQV